MNTIRRPLFRLAGIAAVLLPLLVVSPVAPAGAGTQLQVGVATVVDPIRAAGEPDTNIDPQGNAWITGPAGTSTQTSWFWHTLDGGLSYNLVGPGGGHALCSTGGGDSLVRVDKVNGDVYLSDQQALVSIAGGITHGDGGSLSGRCFATPAMSADRPFQTVLHPTGPVRAPQYVEDGRPINYESWLCDACLGAGSTVGGLAFGWTDDGLNWHAADPGVPLDNLAVNQFFEAPAITSFEWHGTMAVDPVTGYVFTGISCSSGNCPNGTATSPEFGVAVGHPACTAAANCPHPGTRADATNRGQFADMTYQTVSSSYLGQPWPEVGSLFPVIAMDSARNLYEAWIEGKGSTTSGTPPSASWHVYYSYSTDLPDHRTWSAPIQVDQGAATQTSVMAAIAAGDDGNIAVGWLGSPARAYPSDQSDPARPWHPFLATVTGAHSAPSIQSVQVGAGPNHLGDICLQGTVCGATSPPGNRNMADFISVDIGPDGAAQLTWASDANQAITAPSSRVAGAPLTMTARQISGPRLIGGGTLADTRFSTVPNPAGVSDVTGDAVYPVWPRSGGVNVPQLDLTASRLEWDGANVIVHLSVANLASLASPDTSNQTHVWWLTTWMMNGRIYFAKAESDGGGAPMFTAGRPASYDRPGLTYYTVPTLLDYRGGAPVSGQRNGNEFVVTVPAAAVGNPPAGTLLESITGFSVLDNGQQPFVTATSNVPTVVDATPAYNFALVAGPIAPTPTPSVGGTGGSGGSGGSAGSTSVLPFSFAAGRDLRLLLGPALLVGLGVLLTWPVLFAVARRRRRRSRGR